MNIPCPTPPVVCPSGTDGDDALITNASVETPDVRMFFAYRYALRSSSFCEATTQLAADLCALNPTDEFDTDTIYSSAEQTCTIDCSGSLLSYTAPAGAALGLSQAEADAAAYALACVGAAIVCGGGSGLLVPNEAQTCFVTCEDGSVVSSTIPAGALQGFSQSEANASAYAIACQAAAAQCPDIPPPNFGNVALSASSDCPLGDGTFTYFVAANTFFASTQAEANAAAQSYADQQSVLARFCLKDIQDVVCGQGDTLYDAQILTSTADPTTLTMIGGSLPPGLTFDNGHVSGGPFVPGAYSFTVRATLANGNYNTRTYSIAVIKINEIPIPDGAVGTPYSHTLTQTGATTPVWSSSKLPTGLTLNSSTGEISGTPTEATNNPNLFVTLTQGVASCTFQFGIEMVLNPLDWWKMDEAANDTRFGSVNGIPLICSANVSSVAGGKYGNATELNSTQPGPSSSCGNTALPVTGLAYAGNGIDAFVWIHIPAVPSSDTILLISFCDSSGASVWAMRFTVDNLVGVEFDMTGGTSGSQPLPTSPDYRLFELYYDPSILRLGLRVNNGFVDSWITVGVPVPVTAKGSISITYDRKSAGSSAAEVCEMAVYPAILNATQRAFIYNLGNGQTWPNSLP